MIITIDVIKIHVKSHDKITVKINKEIRKCFILAVKYFMSQAANKCTSLTKTNQEYYDTNPLVKNENSYQEQTLLDELSYNNIYEIQTCMSPSG